MNKHDILDRTKIPVSKHKHVGIEIEFIADYDRDDIEDLLCDFDLQNNCTIKGDGSLSGEREAKEKMPKYKHPCHAAGWQWYSVKGKNWSETKGWEKQETVYHTCSGCEAEGAWEEKHGLNERWDCHEMTILTTESEMRSVLNKVNQVLKKIKAEVNSSCGLHVHLDMRSRDYKKCAGLLITKQKEFHKMVDKNRLKSEYCKPLKKDELKEDPEYVERYRDININAYEKFGTIEVRIHEGTVNTSEIYNWCKYLIAIVDNKKVSKVYVQKRTMECA